MAGRATAVHNGAELVSAVKELAEKLGLTVKGQVAVARRIWGAVRKIDLVITDPASHKRLGVECKYQGGQGTAEEKIPSTIQDIAAWPIPGIVVFAGAGMTRNMQGFLVSTGRAVHLDDLEPWLKLFFGLDL